jgi:cytochrome c nitrite reductase small subunit
MRLGAARGVALGVTIGIAGGIGVFTFSYAKGWSYMTDNPAACANCHIMRDQYDGWTKSSHRSVAVCNDCHTPAGFFGKYSTKARNGFWHSYYFTTGRFKEPIEITARSREIAEQACRKCHQEITTAIDAHAEQKGGEQISCIRCHKSVGHYE